MAETDLHALIEQKIAAWRESSTLARANADNPHIATLDRRQCFGVSQAYEQCADELAALLSGRPSPNEPLTVQDCLDEVQRLKAENERLTRLAMTRRPELTALRDIEVGLRESRKFAELHAKAVEMLQGNDDLPSLMEMRGILSDGKERVDAALASAASPIEEPTTDPEAR